MKKVKKNLVRKLQVSRATVRRLNDDLLHQAAGGVPTNGARCKPRGMTNTCTANTCEISCGSNTH